MAKSISTRSCPHHFSTLGLVLHRCLRKKRIIIETIFLYESSSVVIQLFFTTMDNDAKQVQAFKMRRLHSKHLWLTIMVTR